MKMKGFCLAAIFVFTLQNGLFAQKTDYKVWFRLQKPSSNLNAQIEQLKDSSIVVSSVKTPTLDKFDIPVTRINEIHWREKGKIGRGMGIGAAIGFGVGFILGVGTAHGEPSDFIYISPVEQGLGFGIIGGLAGGVVGGIVSAFDTKISIGGSQAKYEKQKEKLRQLTRGQQ